MIIKFDVRAMVPGICDPIRVSNEIRHDRELGARLGAAIGGILAEQHSCIVAEDVADWLPFPPTWPQSSTWVREQLVKVIDDAGLMAGAMAVMRAYEHVHVSEGDRALVHTDVGFHNMGIDLESKTVLGLFDYDSAAWADRHHDFRYLVFDPDQYELLDAVRSVYEPATGREIDRARVLLYNAACAITFLAHRAGTAPEDRPCGRTLAEDLRWSRQAIAQVLKA